MPKSKVDKRYTQYVDGDKMVMRYSETHPGGNTCW
ncbi:hypothetical protein H4W30_002814 [Amycolatopsis roodepoortensis]|uniref:Uncharacterized protein n=1 Tax=Amycolatopsis roodepoortensis TaxID=700274 RepID=A0ABR9L5C7_9PSEU|nr:hypothetical protein [Amycolatopsis roodepoortensis]